MKIQLKYYFGITLCNNLRLVTMVNKLLRIIKFLLLRLLRINDSAHGIAVGFTMGLLINFTPTFGIGPILSAICARLFKGNPVAGFIGGLAFLWVFPILFYLNLLVGGALLTIEIIDFKDIVGVLDAGVQIGEAFFIGMLINILIFGTIFYFFIFIIVNKYRMDMLMFIYKKWRL